MEQLESHDLKATVTQAAQALSPFLEEIMADVVHPWQRVLNGQGDAKDFAIVGAEAAAAVAAVVIPGTRALAAKFAEHNTHTKTLEEQWQTLTRRFGGSRIYGVSSEDLREFVMKNKKNQGRYLQPLDSSLTT